MPLTTIVLIPAYKPTADFPEFIRHLAQSDVCPIVIVNDGSGREFDAAFASVKGLAGVTVIGHEVNQGKGAALKTGLRYIADHYPAASGVITADADGQHLVADIQKVGQALAAHPQDLILGARAFDKEVPLRSKFGNTMTKYLFRLMTGRKITDTQTGLRAIPADLIPALLEIPSNRYEFELDMLLVCKANQRQITEVPITTVYIEGNKSSHFNPVKDSMKIYFVLFRSVIISLLSAAIDYLIFIGIFALTASVAGSQVTARACSMVFNYLALKKRVFQSRRAHHLELPRYLALVVISGGASYVMIEALVAHRGMGVLLAKVSAEILIYFINFIIQRNFIFAGSRKSPVASAEAASETARRNAGSKALRPLIQRFAPDVPLRVAEIYGIGKGFATAVVDSAPVTESPVPEDTAGQAAFAGTRTDTLPAVPAEPPHDVVFSMGLLKRVSAEEMTRAIDAHFRHLKPGGIAIIRYPARSRSYWCRRLLGGLLSRHDVQGERPLLPEEVARVASHYGDVLLEKAVWPTQRLIVIRKAQASPGSLHAPVPFFNPPEFN